MCIYIYIYIHRCIYNIIIYVLYNKELLSERALQRRSNSCSGALAIARSLPAELAGNDNTNNVSTTTATTTTTTTTNNNNNDSNDNNNNSQFIPVSVK